MGSKTKEQQRKPIQKFYVIRNSAIVTAIKNVGL